jgi:ribosome-binding factor A
VTRRTDRISEVVRGEVARVIRQEASDPRLRLVTLTRVDVAPDLSHALVFWSVFEPTGDVDLQGVQDALDSASGFVRGRIARALPLKRVPELRFRYDPSLEQGNETLSLLRDIADEQKT